MNQRILSDYSQQSRCSGRTSNNISFFLPEKEICLFLPKSKWVLGAPIPPAALLKLSLTTDAHLSCNNVSVAQQEMNVGHHDGAISHPDLANLATISPLFSLLAVVSCSALFTCSRDSRKAQWGKSFFSKSRKGIV